MLEQRSRPETGTSEYKDRRRMFLALVLLLAALVVVAVKNRDIWFGSGDDSAAAETPIWVPSRAAQTPLAAAPTAKAKPHVAVKTSTKAPVAEAAVVASRTALPPLGIEVVSGDAHHTVHAHSDSVKVVQLPDSSAGAAESASGEFGPATNAADRMRLSSADARAVPHTVETSYPLLAQQMKVQGSVLLQALIGADGIIRDLRVLTGPAILASAAREAVRQWRFKPYLHNGQPVETSANITVNFSIKVLDKATRDQLGTMALSTGGD